MSKLFGLFLMNGLLPKREFRDCHVVIDGSNLSRTMSVEPFLMDFAKYDEFVRLFFRWLQKANITAHVLFDGPSFGGLAHDFGGL